MKWWRLRNRDEDLRRELESDLELEEEEQRERGLSSEEARYAARRAFGNPTLIREHTRAIWNRGSLERLARDLKHGTRTLLRSPGFSLISVLVMALSIGATTSLFTMVRAVLLRPLPFRDSGKLVMLYEHFRHNKGGDGFNAVAPGDYRDWRSQTHGFEDMAAMRGYGGILSGVQSELPEVAQSAGGSSNFFSLLGVAPAFGRGFTEAKTSRKVSAWSCLRGACFSAALAEILPLSANRFIWIRSLPPSLACCRVGLLIPMPGSSSGCLMRRRSRSPGDYGCTTATRAWWWHGCGRV